MVGMRGKSHLSHIHAVILSLKLKLQYHLYRKMAIQGEIYVVLQPSLEKRLYVHVTDLVYIEIETYKNRGRPTCRCKANIVSEVSSVRDIFT